jgi:molecular chaperone Hsp33
VRVVAVEATALAERTREVHGLAPFAASTAAELTAATVLLSAHVKGDERISLQLQASSPRCAWYGEVGDRNFRGRFTPTEVPPRAVVSGVLVAIQSVAGRERYRGTSEIDGETVEGALQRYLATSVQVGGALRLGALCHASGAVAFAGGVLIERLPDEPDWPTLSEGEFEERASRLRATPVDELVFGVMGGELPGERIEILEDEPIEWRCTCSRERVERMLVSLGGNEIRSLILDPGQAEITCHFCQRVEIVLGERLEELLAGMVEA